MGFFSDFKTGIITSLSRSGSFADIRLTDEYHSQPKENPIASRFICVGFDEIKSEAGTAAFMGTDEQSKDEIYGKNVSIKVKLDIFVPAKQGGLVCHEIFSRLADYFLLSQDEYRVSGFQCGEIVYDKLVGAYRLTAVADIKASALYTRSDCTFEDIEITRG